MSVQIKTVTTVKIPDKYIPSPVVYVSEVNGIYRLYHDANCTKMLTRQEMYDIYCSATPILLDDNNGRCGLCYAARGYSSSGDSFVWVVCQSAVRQAEGTYTTSTFVAYTAEYTG